MAWADLTDCRAYYELIGEGEPLLLIPGLGATCRLWDPIVPELARHFTLIMLDNRGMGLSKAKKKPRTLADYSADYAELLDFLNVDQSHVLGLSLGGIAAQRLAIDHPQKIKRLILMSCADRFAPYLLRITALLGHSLRRFPRMLFLQTMELLATAQRSEQLVDRTGIHVRAGASSSSGDQLRDREVEVLCVADDLSEHPRPEDHDERGDPDDLGDEGEALLLDLGDRLEDAH